MLALLLAPHAHVPIFGCVENCCPLRHEHTLSQAFYATAPPGTRSGVEIHIRGNQVPLDTVNAEKIDFGASFKKKYDPSTMALRIGCGGCFAGDQLPSTQLAISYPSGHVEAFSQAAMFEFDDHEYGSPERQFDSSLVAPAVCADRHFTLVLEVFENATEDVYWAAVIGRGACSGSVWL